MKKLTALILALALVMSMLAGCNNNTSSASPSSAQPSGTTGGDDGTPSEPPTDDATIIGEGSAVTPDTPNTSVLHDVVNIGISTDNGSWDPFNNNGGSGMWGVYQSLGYIIGGEFYPSLAKSYEISDDMKTISFEIFDNIYDSAGVHMTAEDIAWSYDRANEGNTAGLTSLVEELVVTGDYTFEFHLYDELQVGRIDKIVKWFAVCRESYENSPDNMATDPVGTGPYAVTNITSGYSWTFERRDDYWQTDESVNCFRDNANVQTINYYVISESAQRAIALQNGSIDMEMEMSSEDREALIGNDNFWFYAVPDDLSIILFPNCDPASPMGDLNTRLAAFYAIDAAAILQGVYDGNGSINHTVAPDWAVGYDPAWANVDSYYSSQNLELAQQYLSESSYNNEKLVILCETKEVTKAAAQIIQVYLESIGIQSEMMALETSVFREYRESANQWDLMISTEACNTYWVDAAYGLLSVDKTNFGASMNFIRDENLEDMLRYTISMSNANADNYDKLNTYILENAYVYSLVNYNSYMTLPSWCSGVALSSKKGIVPGGCIYSE